MRLRFLIASLPRSGSTWLANLLSTPEMLVEHDPLYRTHYKRWPAELDAAACTGIWQWPEWVNSLPIPKIVLLRPLHRINTSLENAGIDRVMRPVDERLLGSILAKQVHWEDMFVWQKAQEIADYLCPGLVIDEGRHHQLCRMNIQPAFRHIAVDQHLQRRLSLELAAKGN